MAIEARPWDSVIARRASGTREKVKNAVSRANWKDFMSLET